MSDLSSDAMYQQRHAHPHSGETLELLGKRAAVEWESGRHATLTESVVATVKQAHLSPEQVKRVVEFCNETAFNREFKKEGTTNKVVDFHGGPADVSDVLKDLNDGGGGSVFDSGTLDYAAPPTETKTASIREENALFELFGEGRDAVLPYENPHGEVIDLKDKLASAEQHLQSQLSGLEVMYADMSDRVYHEVKQAALEGVSLGEILQAWETVAPSEEHIKVAFTLITPRLLREGVFHRVEDMTQSIDKTAGVAVVNKAHPLITEFSDYCDTLSKLAETRSAREELKAHLSSCSEYLKQASLAGTVAKTTAGWADKSAPFLKDQLGKGPGWVASKGIQYAPHLAGAVALNEVDTHGENSPGIGGKVYRGAKHGLLQQIPGTQDNIRHKWEIQSGQ
jgi:hypothetical protein